MEAAPMEAAHYIRANTHRQQTSCMCDISCGICLSHCGWVSIKYHFHAVYFNQFSCGVHVSEWVTRQLRPVCLT